MSPVHSALPDLYDWNWILSSDRTFPIALYKINASCDRLDSEAVPMDGRRKSQASAWAVHEALAPLPARNVKVPRSFVCSSNKDIEQCRQPPFSSRWRVLRNRRVLTLRSRSFMLGGVPRVSAAIFSVMSLLASSQHREGVNVVPPFRSRASLLPAERGPLARAKTGDLDIVRHGLLLEGAAEKGRRSTLISCILHGRASLYLLCEDL